MQGIYRDDPPERKNTIGVSLLPLVSRGASLRYSHKFSDKLGFSINPRVRIAKPEDPGNIFVFAFKDPEWYYDKFQLRIGMIYRIKDRLHYEPQLQLGYGRFYNRRIENGGIEKENEEFIRVDRRYSSAGILNTISSINEYNRFGVRWFCGIGLHARMVREKLHERLENEQLETFPDPLKSSYWRFVPTIHAGVELGFRW